MSDGPTWLVLVYRVPSAPSRLRVEVEDMGGSAQLLRAETLVGQADVIAAFNTARDAEYTEVISRCEDFLVEIDKETRAGKFTYAELEENEEDLTKLRGWLGKIRGRDMLDAARAQEAISAVQACAQALDIFAEQVYAADTAD